MTRSLPRDRGSVALALATYTGLLRLYPAAFRQRFGHEMTQVFRDGCRAAWHTQGGWGVLVWLLTTLPDVFITASRERFAQRKTTWGERMSPQGWVRLGGIMAFVAVACLMVNLPERFIDGSDVGKVISVGSFTAAQVAELLMYVGLAAVQRSQVGRVIWGIVVVADVLVIIISTFAVIQPQALNNTPFVRGYGFVWGVVAMLVFAVAIVGSVIIWRNGLLGRWSPMPFFAQLWPPLSASLSVVLFGAFAMHLNTLDAVNRYFFLTGIVLALPTWLFISGTGLGLLHVARQRAARPAASPSDAVQLSES